MIPLKIDNTFEYTPKKETHRLQNIEYQLVDLRPILIFFCCSLKAVLLAPEGEFTADPTWLAGAVGKSSPGTGLVGEILCSLCENKN